MKANLPQNEPKMLARWEQMRIYELIREARRGAPMYVLHDGPPYANGPIHLGTALNKTVKDFVVKSKNMAGFDAPYMPGWDCHGLPIEIKVDEALGGKKLEMDPLQVRQACSQYAEKYLDLQRQQFKRIGVFGRWERPYSTMTPEYEAVVIDTLFRFVEQGAVYKGLRPVYWCIHDQTALAEAEVEYKNHVSPSIWVKYRMQSDPRLIDAELGSHRVAGKPVNTIIWTTTPWTLPASMAVAFHPDEEYVALESGGELYIVAEKLAQVTAEKCGLQREGSWRASRDASWSTRTSIIRSCRGRTGRFWECSPITSHGRRHRRGAHRSLARRRRLLQRAEIQARPDMQRGRGGPPAERAAGVRRQKGIRSQRPYRRAAEEPRRAHAPGEDRALLSALLALSQPGDLPRHRAVVHLHGSEDRHPRTRNRSASGDPGVGGGTLRSRALEEIKKSRWDPAWGEERISNMIATRPDWCISRQRVWGVPIAIIFCEGCNEILRSPEVERSIVELFRREGSDAWYRRKPEEIVPAGTQCAKCGGTRFRKEMDIIDVWFESGSSYLAVQSSEPDLPWPSDLYLEGGDQYRGWFHSSLLCAIGARNSAPYRTVGTIGWTLDMQGRAMPKSLGNDVDPVDIANRMGGEIVRLWVASVDFRDDVRSDEALMQRIAETYRKIRNTFRYILSNLYDFDPGRDAVPFAEMEFLDRVALAQTAQMAERVLGWYRDFLFHRVFQDVNTFCVDALSATYFDIVKDRLYTYAPDSRGRRSAQTAIWRIGEALVRLLAPVMSFTADEIWGYLPKMAGREPSVHVAKFPEPETIPGEGFSRESQATQQLLAEWQDLARVRDEVLKALETARAQKQIGSSLEAEVRLSVPESLYPAVQRHEKDLRYLFIVSNVQLEAAPSENGSGGGITVEIRRAPGEKCERCWNYSTQVGIDPKHPTVCERCSAALKEIETGADGH